VDFVKRFKDTFYPTRLVRGKGAAQAEGEGENQDGFWRAPGMRRVALGFAR